MTPKRCGLLVGFVLVAILALVFCVLSLTRLASGREIAPDVTARPLGPCSVD